jgi:hypothetical protein
MYQIASCSKFITALVVAKLYDLGKINYIPPKQYTNKQGWCWIGKDRGFNSCIEVGRNEYCMSGDVYPTKDICINPSLRL